MAARIPIIATTIINSMSAKPFVVLLYNDNDISKIVFPFIPDIPYHKYNLEPILTNYIYHKNEIGKPGKMDLPLLKNDITTN